jgi:hypothetical protein
MRDQRGELVLAPRAGFEPATIRLTVESERFSNPLTAHKVFVWASNYPQFVYYFA